MGRMCVEKYSNKPKFCEAKETGQMQLVQLPSFSDSLWLVTPSAIMHFRRLLLDEDALMLKIYLNYQFVRGRPEEQTTTDGEFHIKMTNSSRCAMAARLGASN